MFSIRIPYSEQIAKLSFVIFVFTTLFGTSMPFQQTLEEAGEVATSNIVNLILFPTLFTLSLIAFIPKVSRVIEIVKNEKMLIVFLLWALFSISWSSYPFVSFKRWFTIFNYYFITIVFLSYCSSVKEIIKTIKPIVYIYLAISIVVVFIIPGAKDPRFGTWRGLTSHKNQLGQVGLICTILTSLFYSYEKVLLNKLIAILFLLISIGLILGAASSTSIISFLIFFLGSMLFFIQNSIFKNVGAGKFISLLTFFSFIGVFYLLYTQAPELIEAMNMTGKDATTFSDRTYLWEYIIIEISKHPILGCGFRGFWVVDSPVVLAIWSAFPFTPIQSHNGYLDIMNEVGIIGIGLLITTLLNYFLQVNRVKGKNFWIWFILLPLFINATETTLFREGHITFIFFIIAYLLPFVFPDSGTESDAALYNQDN